MDVEAGQHAEPTLLQERLAARLTGHAVSFPAAEVGRHRLADLLADRAVLLVGGSRGWVREPWSGLTKASRHRAWGCFTTRQGGHPAGRQ